MSGGCSGIENGSPGLPACGFCTIQRNRLSSGKAKLSSRNAVHAPTKAANSATVSFCIPACKHAVRDGLWVYVQQVSNASSLHQNWNDADRVLCCCFFQRTHVFCLYTPARGEVTKILTRWAVRLERTKPKRDAKFCSLKTPITAPSIRCTSVAHACQAHCLSRPVLLCLKHPVRARYIVTYIRTARPQSFIRACATIDRWLRAEHSAY